MPSRFAMTKRSVISVLCCLIDCTGADVPLILTGDLKKYIAKELASLTGPLEPTDMDLRGWRAAGQPDGVRRTRIVALIFV